MNKIFLAIVTSILFSYSCANKSKEPKMKVQINIVKKLDSDKFKRQKGTFYSANINLINNTDSVIHFWIMSCSWQDNWIFNYDNIRLYNDGCDKNIPKFMSMERGKTLNFNGIVQILDAFTIINQKDLLLGFVIIKEHEILGVTDFRSILIDKINTRQDIVWSETIKIKK